MKDSNSIVRATVDLLNTYTKKFKVSVYPQLNTVKIGLPCFSTTAPEGSILKGPPGALPCSEDIESYGRGWNLRKNFIPSIGARWGI